MRRDPAAIALTTPEFALCAGADREATPIGIPRWTQGRCE